MPTPVIYEEPPLSPERLPGEETLDALNDRVHRLESEVTELRGSVARLADLVVIDIKQRREDRDQSDVTVTPTVLSAVATAAVASASGSESPSVWAMSKSAIGSLRKPWLIIEVLREMMLALRMYFDPRYRVRRSTQLMVPLLLGGLILNYFFFAQLFDIWIISPISERLILLLLGVLLYKIVSREAARYRDVLAEYQAQGVRETTGYMYHDEPALSRQHLE